MKENNVLQEADKDFDSYENTVEIVKILDTKKAQNIMLLHVEEKTTLCEYFVICEGNSTTQVKALADEVEYKMGLLGVSPRSIEGDKGSTWILLDFGFALVHVFTKEAREFYKLEKLWADSQTIDISNIITED